MSSTGAELGPIIGVILAGGLSSRMGGGDKGLRALGDRPLLLHVIQRLRPQVERLVLNANGDPARFAGFNLPVIPDSVPDFAGPLAGILAGMDWAADELPEAHYIVTVPADGPFLPRDLVAHLGKALLDEDAELAVAASAGQPYPVIGLWPVALREDLRRALTVDNLHKVDAWTARYRRVTATFSTDPVDPFFNANTPEQLAEAERLLASHPGL
jgi:molybdopterin-guanine dinucleotide biosynthesis protein A